MQSKSKTYTVQEAIAKLEYYCAYQERCHKEVVAKLQQMNMIPEAINHIVVHLINNNYLNEERFAKEFVLGKFSTKKWGRLRLTRELKQRNISKYNIDAAFKLISEATYLKTFNELANKKAAQLREPNKLKRKKKLADYLLYRGWEPHLVYQKVNELCQ